jgi:glycosyltransferase involved in cell wall biosynthesis
MSSAAPGVAIVVSTKGRSDKIGGLLQSLASIQSEDVQIIIVDQSEDDATRDVVANYLSDPRLTYTRSRQTGLSRGRNLGIRLTTAPIICITDDDCIVPPNWPERMAEPFADERVGVVWCSVVPLEARTDGHTPNRVFDGDSVIRDVDTAWRRAEHGFNLGAGLALRRTAYDSAGGFDDHLGAGSTFPSAEDNDLAWRCLLRGWWVREVSTVEVVHDGFRTMEETKALAVRDFRGIGGAFAKYVRVGRLRALRLPLVWTFRFWAAGPLREIAHGHRPTGLRRPFVLWRGFFSGLRRNMERSTITYRQ